MKTTNKTFTKIRKWAEEKGYEVVDNKYFDEITVIVSKDLTFKVENRESTIYMSIKGIRGNAKGIYLTANKNGRYGFAFHHTTQKSVIKEIERDIEEYENKKAKEQNDVEEVIEVAENKIEEDTTNDVESKEKGEPTMKIEKREDGYYAVKEICFEFGKVEEKERVTEDGLTAVTMGMNVQAMINIYEEILLQKTPETTNKEEYQELLNTYLQLRLADMCGLKNQPLVFNEGGELEGLKEEGNYEIINEDD